MRKKRLMTNRYHCKYLFAKDIYQLQDEYPDSTTHPICGLEVLIDGTEDIDGIINVSLVGIEYKDDCGISLYADCFEITELVEDSFDNIVHQISHLVSQVIKCRNNNDDFNRLDVI